MRRLERRRGSRGQSLAEFAIVFPIFMLIVGGIIQFGMIFWGQNTLNQIVRDSGRYAVTEQDCSAASQTDVQSKITSVANGTFLGGSVTSIVVMPTTTSPDPTSDPCPAVSNAKQVWIRITANAQVPIFFPAIPGNGSISSTALFRMEPVTP
jgi:Flp pilus assembly protein TadG